VHEHLSDVDLEAAMVLSRSLLGHLQLVVDSPANSGGAAVQSEDIAEAGFVQALLHVRRIVAEARKKRGE